jgi:hypothetical protein
MLYIDDICPVCHPEQSLLLNTGDLFECPSCHLQIGFVGFPVAALLAVRGEGKFRETKTTVPPHFQGSLLAKAKSRTVLPSDNIIQTREEIEEFLIIMDPANSEVTHRDLESNYGMSGNV